MTESTLTTSYNGVAINAGLDLKGVPVYYNNLYCGVIESQTLSDGKTDFVIRWDSPEIAEAMRDKVQMLTGIYVMSDMRNGGIE